MMLLSDIDKEIYNCVKCLDMVEKFPNSKTVSIGKKNDIVILGEAPANNGWRKSGIAWYDVNHKLLPSGVILQKLLNEINLTIEDTYFLEAIKCFPKDRKYLGKCSVNCKQFLMKQLEIIKPKVVLCLGDAATKTLLDIKYKKFSGIVGKEFIVNGIRIIPIYHPSPISPMSYKGNIDIFKNLIINKIEKEYLDKYKKATENNTEEILQGLERHLILTVVDEKWMDHIDNITGLKDGIGLRAYGQSNPVEAYKMDKWLKWAMEIQSLAQSGLAYTNNVYDIERYERLREISADIIEEKSNINFDKVKNLFCNETGYQTPKIDTRAIIFKDNKILLVHESNGTWSLPGGWCDVLESVKTNTIKEVKEETGLDVIATRIIAIQDRNKHNKPIYAYGICKVFVQCDILGGKFEENIETTEIGYFSLNEIPENLAVEKINMEQIEMCFKAINDKNWQVQFD